MNLISIRQGVKGLSPTCGVFTFVLGVVLVMGLSACFQNPSTEPPEDSRPQYALIREAEEHYRNNRFAQAMAAYEAALALDSTLSAAYYGHSKATLGFYGINTTTLYEEWMEAISSDMSPILDHPDSVLTKRLQATKRTRLMLGMLTDRDTLTRWYNYLDETTPWSDGVADTMYQQRRDFMTEYLIKADLLMPGYRARAAFPLSDLKVSAASIANDYVMLNLFYTITRLYDFDLNDTIDARDSLMKKLKFGSNGSFGIDSLSNLGDELGDSAASMNLNDLILKLQNGLDGSLCAFLVGGCSSLDSGDLPVTPGSGSQNMDSVIAALGETVMFYQFGDGLDNDGDGCIDEEIMDEKDNDLDGFIDEDARVIPANKPDGVDNDRDGFKDPVNPVFPHAPGTDTLGREAPVGSEVYPAKPHVLGFVHAYLMATGQLNLPDIQTDWVRIKKNAPPEEMALRLLIQRDSLAARIPVGGPVPDSLKAKLQHAKNVVGGCWRNYP
jgi:hypothetical protein